MDENDKPVEDQQLALGLKNSLNEFWSWNRMSTRMVR